MQVQEVGVQERSLYLQDTKNGKCINNGLITAQCVFWWRELTRGTVMDGTIWSVEVFVVKMFGVFSRGLDGVLVFLEPWTGRDHWSCCVAGAGQVIFRVGWWDGGMRQGIHL